MWATVSAGPVEDPLGQPVIGRGVALGVLPGGLLRHVDDAVDAGLLRGLGEVRRRLQDAGADGVDEVGPLHAVQRGTHLPEVEQVAVDDLDARVPGASSTARPARGPAPGPGGRGPAIHRPSPGRCRPSRR